MVRLSREVCMILRREGERASSGALRNLVVGWTIIVHRWGAREERLAYSLMKRSCMESLSLGVNYRSQIA